MAPIMTSQSLDSDKGGIDGHIRSGNYCELNEPHLVIKLLLQLGYSSY